VAIMPVIIYKSTWVFTFFTYNTTFINLMVFAIFLTLAQVVLSTQVRQSVDEQLKAVGYVTPLWLENPEWNFYIHRTLSVLVVFTTAWLVYLNKKLQLGYKKINVILILIVLEIITGMLMYYFDFPFSTQTLHLVIA